jgi:hypothetical protein
MKFLFCKRSFIIKFCILDYKVLRYATIKFFLNLEFKV